MICMLDLIYLPSHFKIVTAQGVLNFCNSAYSA